MARRIYLPGFIIHTARLRIVDTCMEQLQGIRKTLRYTKSRFFLFIDIYLYFNLYCLFQMQRVAVGNRCAQ